MARQVAAAAANVRDWESGRRRPEVYTLRRVATALAVDVLDLLEDGTPVDLRVLRTRVGRTQEHVAALANMPRHRYAAIERAERDLTNEDAEALAQSLSDPDGHITTTVAQIREAHAVAGADWPTPSRPVQLPGEVAARVSAARLTGESFASALQRVIEAGLDTRRE